MQSKMAVLAEIHAPWMHSIRACIGPMSSCGCWKPSRRKTRKNCDSMSPRVVLPSSCVPGGSEGRGGGGGGGSQSDINEMALNARGPIDCGRRRGEHGSGRDGNQTEPQKFVLLQLLGCKIGLNPPEAMRRGQFCGWARRVRFERHTPVASRRHARFAYAINRRLFLQAFSIQQQ